MRQLKLDPAKTAARMQYKTLNNAGLAKAAGISANSVSALMTGKSAPRAKTLRAICDALECEPIDILEEVKQ